MPREHAVPDFTRRATGPELMDDPAVPPQELRQTLQELETIHRLLGGYGPSRSGVVRLLRDAGADRPGAEVSLLDVGSGGGDVAWELVRAARARGIRLRVLGIDTQEECVRRARERCSALEEVEFRRGDFLDPATFGPDEQAFDIVHASLVLHHFSEDDAVRALRAMHDRARLGVVVSELHRHPVAWAAIRVLTGVFSRNRLIRHDAPLSVARGFRRGDWEALCRTAGVPPPEVRRRWAFRWEVIVRRSPVSLAPGPKPGPR